MKNICSVAVLFLVGIGCSTVTLPRDQYLAGALMPRASFDLSCSEAELKSKNLQPAKKDAMVFFQGDWILVEDLSTTQGVEGCGKRATYVYHQGKWIMNNGTIETAEPDSAPQ